MSTSSSTKFCVAGHGLRTYRKAVYRNLAIFGTALVLAFWFQSAAHATNTYLLDPNYTGAEGAPFGSYAGAYRLITDALASAGGVPAGASASNPNILSIAPGTYNTALTTGVSLSYSRANVALIGQTGNPNDVVITSTLDSAYNTGSSTIGTSGSATLQLKGNNQTALNITFANSTDTPYITSTGKQTVSPAGNYATGQAQTVNQPAVALLLQGDEQAFQNCKFLGYQDTLYTKGGRSYFKNCTVSGDIDFIFANGTTVFNNSTINLDGDHSGGTITAPSTDKRTSNGIVFLNTTITANSVHGNPVIDSLNAANVNGAASNSMSLGRPWFTQPGGDASAVFINTIMPAAIKPAGWLNWDATEIAGGRSPGLDSRFAEFNSTSDGTTPVDTSQRVSWSHQLNATQAAAYTVTNLFSFEGPTQYPWYGQGYPAGDASAAGTGSPNTTDSNYSWPAYWGDRNTQDENNASLVTGNPLAYSDPSWTVASNWDAEGQLALVPEPSTLCLIGIGAGIFLASGFCRRQKLAK